MVNGGDNNNNSDNNARSVCPTPAARQQSLEIRPVQHGTPARLALLFQVEDHVAQVHPFQSRSQRGGRKPTARPTATGAALENNSNNLSYLIHIIINQPHFNLVTYRRPRGCRVPVQPRLLTHTDRLQRRQVGVPLPQLLHLCPLHLLGLIVDDNQRINNNNLLNRRTIHASLVCVM